MSKRVVVSLKKVVVEYGGEQALKQITLDLYAGEFVGLIGTNGAGKTTLLRTMLGLVPPTSGTVSYGKDVKNSIGYVPQSGTLKDPIVPMSVLDVVKLGSAGNTEVAVRALGDIGLDELVSKRYSVLSGGQQQRVLIAKSLASNSRLLVLDEPTTGIDERSQKEFFGILRTLQQRGITIVMASHDTESMLDLVTRVICINGAVLYDGEVSEFDPADYISGKHQHHERGRHA